MQQNHSHYIYLLSAGHLFTDTNQGALPTTLPFLIVAYHFSYVGVAALVLAFTVVSSIIQLIFGSFASKTPRPWTMTIGVPLAGGEAAAAGFLSDFRLLFVSIIVNGVGIAAFHPEGARMANKVSGGKKGTDISIFSFGGNTGFAVGPILATVSVSLSGLRGTMVLAVLCALVVITILSQIKKMNQTPSEQDSSEIIPEEPAEPDKWVPFTLLSLLLFGRSIVFCGLNTFLPPFFARVLQQSESMGNTLLSFYFTVEAVNTLIGGRLSDRFGFTKITRISSTLLLSALATLAMVRAITPAVSLLIPVIYAPYSPSNLMVMPGQEYLPNRMGLASGITLGLLVGIDGMITLFLGHLVDRFGLMAAIYAITTIPIIPAMMSYTLSKEDRKERVAQNSRS